MGVFYDTRLFTLAIPEQYERPGATKLPQSFDDLLQTKKWVRSEARL